MNRREVTTLLGGAAALALLRPREMTCEFPLTWGNPDVSRRLPRAALHVGATDFTRLVGEQP
jgi:hypothetical protein